MAWKEKEERRYEQRTDPDANPLTSFGRDDEFTEELISGICENKDSTSVTPKESVNLPGLREAAQSKDEGLTEDRQRNSRKKRRGIA